MSEKLLSAPQHLTTSSIVAGGSTLGPQPLTSLSIVARDPLDLELERRPGWTCPRTPVRARLSAQTSAQLRSSIPTIRISAVDSSPRADLSSSSLAYARAGADRLSSPVDDGNLVLGGRRIINQQS